MFQVRVGFQNELQPALAEQIQQLPRYQILLIYFPPLILYFNDIKRAKRWLWIGGKKAPSWADVEPTIKNLKRVKEFEEK